MKSKYTNRHTIPILNPNENTKQSLLKQQVCVLLPQGVFSATSGKNRSGSERLHRAVRKHKEWSVCKDSGDTGPNGREGLD